MSDINDGYVDGRLKSLKEVITNIDKNIVDLGQSRKNYIEEVAKDIYHLEIGDTVFVVGGYSAPDKIEKIEFMTDVNDSSIRIVFYLERMYQRHYGAEELCRMEDI